MRRAAFSVWDSRIAPVFDVARQLLLVEAKAGRVTTETNVMLPDDPLLHKALSLADLGIDILICGAISRPLQDVIETYGTRVIPFVAGELGEVKCAWLAGGGEIRRYAMPGCCGRRRRGTEQMGANVEEQVMKGNSQDRVFEHQIMNQRGGTMKVCFPVVENHGLESEVYGHFGSAPGFVIVDIVSSEITAISNRDRIHRHGACNPVAGLAGHEVDAIVVGGIGGGALHKLNSAGMRVFRARQGTVGENVALFRTNCLQEFLPGHTCGGHDRGQGCSH